MIARHDRLCRQLQDAERDNSSRVKEMEEQLSKREQSMMEKFKLVLKEKEKGMVRKTPRKCVGSIRKYAHH